MIISVRLAVSAVATQLHQTHQVFSSLDSSLKLILQEFPLSTNYSLFALFDTWLKAFTLMNTIYLNKHGHI